MADTEDAHGIFFEGEWHTVVAEPEPERTGHVAVERGHAARAGLGETENAFEQAHGRGVVQRADVGLGFVEPLDAVRRHYSQTGEGNVKQLQGIAAPLIRLRAQDHRVFFRDKGEYLEISRVLDRKEAYR
jgi:hypothetical protein